MVSVTTIQQETIYVETNGDGCVTIILYLWTVKFELYIIFMSHEIFFLLFYLFISDHLKV